MAAGSNGGGTGRSRGTVSTPRRAGRALGVREGLVSPSVGAGDEPRRVDDELHTLQRQRVLVHAPRRGTLDPLPREVELRTVARALEPPGRLAERHPAPEMGTLLGDGEQVPTGVGDEQAARTDVGGRVGRVAGRTSEREGGT